MGCSGSANPPAEATPVAPSPPTKPQKEGEISFNGKDGVSTSYYAEDNNLYKESEDIGNRLKVDRLDGNQLAACPRHKQDQLKDLAQQCNVPIDEGDIGRDITDIMPEMSAEDVIEVADDPAPVSTDDVKGDGKSFLELVRKNWGPGSWEASMDGDSETVKDNVWWRVGAKANDVLDEALWAYTCSGKGSRRKDVKGLLKGQDGTVDFDLYTTMYNKRVIPLRRKRSDTKAVTHPDPSVRHPWFLNRLKAKDNETKDFLKNEFFCRAFEQAVGGHVDFDKIFDFRFNEDLRSRKEAPLQRRGGVLYREPVGWKRFAIKSKGVYDNGDNTWMKMSGEEGEWGVAYHGTAMKIVPLIVENGFKVGTGQGAKNCNDVRTGDLVGTGVFCTPNLTPVECYANGNEDKGSEQKEAAATVDGKTLFFAFQCRVNPKAIRRPDRRFARNNDEEIMGVDGVFEWIINNPKDIRPYGVLVREKEGCDHLTLSSLIANDAWNKEHKPHKLGSFDNVKGKDTSAAHLEQLKRSHKQATKELG
jgi:hypothetical protein